MEALLNPWYAFSIGSTIAAFFVPSPTDSVKMSYATQRHTTTPTSMREMGFEAASPTAMSTITATVTVSAVPKIMSYSAQPSTIYSPGWFGICLLAFIAFMIIAPTLEELLSDWMAKSELSTANTAPQDPVALLEVSPRLSDRTCLIIERLRTTCLQELSSLNDLIEALLRSTIELKDGYAAEKAMMIKDIDILFGRFKDEYLGRLEAEGRASELSTELSKLELLRTDLEDHLATMQAERDDAIEQNDLLKQENALLTKRHTSLAQQNASTAKENATLATENSTLQQAVQDKDELWRNSQDEIKTLKQQTASLVQQNSDLTTENGTLKQRNTSLAQRDTSLTQQNASLTQQVASLTTTSNTLRQEVQNKDGLWRDALGDINKLRQKVATSSSSSDPAAEAIKQQREQQAVQERTNMVNEMKRLKDSNWELTKQVQALKAQKASPGAGDMTDVREQRDRALTRIETLLREMKQLKADLATAKAATVSQVAATNEETEAHDEYKAKRAVRYGADRRLTEAALNSIRYLMTTNEADRLTGQTVPSFASLAQGSAGSIKGMSQDDGKRMRKEHRQHGENLDKVVQRAREVMVPKSISIS